MSLASFTSYLSLEKNYSLHTVNAYQRDIEAFQIFCDEEHDTPNIDEVKYSLIRNWIVALVESKISNRTVNRKMASLKAYYTFLRGIGRIDVHPMARHRALKTPKTKEIPFSVKEMQQVLSRIEYPDDFEGARDKLIIELLYATGMRRAELVNLKMADLDLAAPVVKVLGKRNKERIIPLLPSTVQAFNGYLEKRDGLGDLKEESYVFLLKSGHKIYETLVYRIINRYFSQVSTKTKRSPHILRHTFATHLLNEGADLNSVKELLGHASLASTQVYTHNSIAELKKVHALAHPRSKK